MSKLEFEDLHFEEEKDRVKAFFYKNHYFYIDKKELEKIGKFEVEKNALEFDVNEKKARNKFNQILNKGMRELTNTVTKKKSTFVYNGSGIPLIGNGAFGIVDRNSNLIEVKPITGCNMNCIFCSVDEGLRSKKIAEILVDPVYLAEECRKIIEYKGTDCHVTINAHGEPMTYDPMPELVRELKKIPRLKTITIITNGTLLDEKKIDELAEAGLDYFSFSLNAWDERTAKILEGYGKYDVNRIKELVRYAAKKMKVIIAPVLLKGYNEKDMEYLAKFSNETGAKLAIQNFLTYKKGRNPAEQIPWEEFNAFLEKLGKKYGTQVFWDAEDFGIEKTKVLQKPYKKGKIVKARVMMDGRYKGEKIAVADGRCITVPNCDREGFINVKITRDKHNIYAGMLV